MNAALLARMVTYVLSMLIGTIPAYAGGWVSYEFVDGVIGLRVELEGAVLALFTAFGLSGAVLAKWGAK